MFNPLKKPRHKNKKGGFFCNKLLSQRLSAELTASKSAFESLFCEQQQRSVAEQVLVDTILQLEEVIWFKARIEGDPAAAQQQQHGEQHSSRYVTQLLAKAGVQQVQDMFRWTADDFMRVCRDTYHEIPILLDLVGRQEEAPGALPTYMHVAAQQLDQAVDKFVTAGMIGCIYQPIVGSQLGTCAATNMLTMQQEAPPDYHWQHVVQLLKLTQVQLQQLAAGYQSFIHDRRVQQQAQLAVAEVVDNSCSLQLLAAAKESAAAHGGCAAAWEGSGRVEGGLACLVLSSADTSVDAPTEAEAEAAAATTAATAAAGPSGAGVPAGSASQGGSSGCSLPAGANGCSQAGPGSIHQLAGSMPTCAAAAAEDRAAVDALAQRATSTLSASDDDMRAAAAAGAAAAAAAAEQTEPSEADPILMVEGLMKMLHRSSLSLHLLLFNTLTRRQVARLVVASYPFLPRAAPLMEAAVANMQPCDWMLDEQGPEAVAAAAAAAATTRDEQLSWQHSQQRAATLRQQCYSWWSQQ